MMIIGTDQTRKVIVKKIDLLLFVAGISVCSVLYAQNKAGGFVEVGDEEKKESVSDESAIVPKLKSTVGQAEVDEETAPSLTEKLKASQQKKVDDLKTFSSAVNMLRKMGRTEVAFRNGEIYYLPSGGKHNLFYGLFEESEKTNQALSVTVNVKSRTVVEVQKATTTQKEGPAGQTPSN